jgi:hypothetical protein
VPLLDSLGGGTRESERPAGRQRRYDGGRGAGVGGEGGGLPAGRVRRAGGGGGGAGGAQHADRDRAARPEEGHRQGRPGPLVSGDY